MRRKLALGQAQKIAMYDYNIGISSAIEELERMGFNCGYYWETMAKVDDVDENDLNIRTRDKLFKKLHIYKIMQKAYNDIWR